MKHNLAFIKRLFKANNEDLGNKALTELIYKRTRNFGQYKPPVSLTEGLHYRYSESGETWDEYGILSCIEEDELEELKDSEWIYINSPYDCTGKEFTIWIVTSRNSNGTVNWIHHKGIDV